MGLAQPKLLFTEDEYLAMERESLERHEFIDGEIYEIAGESEEHGIVSMNLNRLIGNELLGSPCLPFAKDMKVRSGPVPRSRYLMKGFYSYPDLVVVCGGRQYHDEYRDVLINPTVIIEVLSPSTAAFDRDEKFRRYRENLLSLTDYILVSQTEPFIDHYHREAENRWVLSSYAGLETSFTIESIHCTLRLADVYDRIEFPIEEGSE
jgi:Uma2 family endonuclease